MYLKIQLMIYKSVLFLQNKQYFLALDLNCGMNGNPKHIVWGTRVLVPGHQKSGALPSWPTGFCFTLKNKSFSCLPSAYMCLTQNLVTLEHCQHKMSMHWSENHLNKGRGTSILVPRHQNSGAFSSWTTDFCFHLKTGLQKHEFLLFAKCLYVFHTKPGDIRTLPACIH